MVGADMVIQIDSLNRAYHLLFVQRRLFSIAASIGLSASVVLGFGTILDFLLGHVAHTFRVYESEIGKRVQTEKNLTLAQLPRNRPEDCRASVEPEHHIDGLIANLSSSYSATGVDIVHSVRMAGSFFSPEEVTCVGLIVNETLTDSVTYASGGCEDPAIFLSLDQVDGRAVFGKANLRDCVEGSRIELRWPSGRSVA